MKRIAVFTEGQTELIFVRWLLLRLIDNAKLSFECLELLAHTEANVPFRFSCPNPEVYFRLIDAHGSEGVLSSIREREVRLAAAGYEAIVGLRDMYCSAYSRLSPRIDDFVTQRIIHEHHAILRTMKNQDKVFLYFAVMEIEAWFLGMYNLFRKIDPTLTSALINERLGMDLKALDPQRSFYRPSQQLSQIYAMCGRDYQKSKDVIEELCSRMDLGDFADAREEGRCGCFDEFYRKICEFC